MRALMNWLKPAGVWGDSPFAALPSPLAAPTSETREWCRVVGGLALILSRATPAEVQQKYGAALQLFTLGKKGLERGRGIGVESTLVKQALLEIESVADPMTLASTRLVLSWRRRVERDRAGRDSQQRSSHSTHGASQAPDFDTAQTQLLTEVFDARADALRKTVAGARTTGFGTP